MPDIIIALNILKITVREANEKVYDKKIWELEIRKQTIVVYQQWKIAEIERITIRRNNETEENRNNRNRGKKLPAKW